MNTNMIHNILNVLGLLFGLWATVDLSTLGIANELAIVLAGWFLLISNSLKLIMNASRDGFSGMVKSQPPVEN